MNAGKIAEYAVGILVPLGMFWAEERGWFRWLGMGEGAPDSARKDGGVAPASLPLFRIWDITHPVGMSGNPACVPSGGVGQR